MDNDHLKEWIRRCFGNRVNLAGITSVVAGIESIVLSTPFASLQTLTGAGVVIFGGWLLRQVEDCGAETEHYYSTTQEHINRFGHLGDEYLKIILTLGLYCTRQGVYLAARDAGLVQEFRDAE